MSRKEDILGVLAGESGPMNRAVMARKIGKPTSDWQKQLNGYESQKLVVKNDQMEYSLTEAGYEVLRASPPEPEPEPEQAAGEVTPPGEVTDETLKTTEWQHFITFGKTTGVVPMALIEQTAKHVWSGGDFRDVAWVWHGLTQMGIRPDLAQRWWHSWRSYLHRAIPPELAESVGVQTPAAKGAEAAGKGKRDYILGPNDLPLFVGEAVGDLDYEDAVKLSAIRAAGLARGGGQSGPPGQPATAGSMADELIKIVTAFKETLGPQAQGKSYVVKPGEEGYIVEEVEQGKPTIISTPGQVPKVSTPSPSWMVDTDSGEVTELTPGKPMVIKQRAEVAPLAKTYLVRQTAEGVVTEEYEPGKPIIIQAPPAPGGSTMSPMLPFPAIGGDGRPVYDKEGNPIYVDIEPQLRWMTFQGEQKRADDRQQALTGLIQTVRENIPDGIQAILKTVAEVKGGPKTKKVETPQVYKCGDCQAAFSIPPEADPDLPVKCPGCGREYSREELSE